MLDTLDVLIGFTVVMLVVSMAVTMITQAFSTALMNLRGRCLHEGVAKLLAIMDRGLKPSEASRLAEHILRNPLVGSPPMFGKGRHGLTSVIHREELTKLILDFAVPGDAEKANDAVDPDEEALREKVRTSLAANGIADPKAVLEAVRAALVTLERTHPELSHNARLNAALLQCAASDYLNKLNSWFDQTIDRVSELFTRRIRAVTVVVAVILAFLIQLDSVGLINRLSVDDDLRSQLVTQALDKTPEWGATIEAAKADIARRQAALAGNGTQTEEAPDANSGTTDISEAGNEQQPAPEPSAAPPPTTSEALDSARRTIEGIGIVSLPATGAEWGQAWWESPAQGGGFRWTFFFGILLSAALLSLGAPFWYAALANLLKLRSVIARKDEVQRVERQTTQTVQPGAPLPLPVTPVPNPAETPPAEVDDVSA